MQYENIKVPKDGQRITINPDASLNVPDNPIIAFIEGDGIGIDITPVMLKVVNAAVEKAYGGKRQHRLDRGVSPATRPASSTAPAFPTRR